MPYSLKCHFNSYVYPAIYMFSIILIQTEAVRALTGEKLHTMNLMVEQERRNVESLRQDLAAASGASSITIPSTAHDQRQQELDQAVRRLTKLEEQLEGLKAGKVNVNKH